ncbi:MAG TPA: hypothetical protein PKA55_12745 [Rhodoblastus sp.]|nr:hypothetical protein [Rhodoblastus sp.]
MADEASGFRFLYRTDQGRIDRARWLRAAAPLALSFAVTTAVMLALLPWANRPLSERAFFDPAALAANTYILAYAALTIFIAISWVNLGAKRFRDRGRPAPLGLAGLLPLAMLVAGAAAWLQPRVAEVMPRAAVWACEVALIVVAIWTVLEMFDLIAKGRFR